MQNGYKNLFTNIKMNYIYTINAKHLVLTL